VSGCGDTETITRTWTATDACGNSTGCEQVIVVEDTTKPTIECPPDVTVECGDSTDPAQTGTATGSDTCGEVTISSSDSFAAACGQTGVITRTWTAEDACGNTMSCDQLITIEDTTKPSISCPSDVTVQCGDPTDPGSTGEATGSDTCGEVAISFADTTDPDCAGTGTITRTWTAEDDCGNTMSCDQIITILDDGPPTIDCPDDVTVECGDSTEPAQTGTATGSDGCSDVTISSSDSFAADCGLTGVITRTWTAEDACGNTASCDQLITIVDTTKPSVSCPPQLQLSCVDPLPPLATTLAEFLNQGGTASDTCGDVSLVDSGEEVSVDGCTVLIERLYVIADACGNEKSCVQLITVVDDIPPVIECPPPGSAQCIEDVPAPAANLAEFVDQGGSASDSCGAVTVTWLGDSDDGEPCPLHVTRTYKATDECGNESTCTQTFIVNDTLPPVITCPPDVTVECPGSTDPASTGSATATDNCDDAPEILFQDKVIPVCGDTKRIIRTWAAIDECGNRVSCDQSILVVDTTPPTITCPPNLVVDCGDSTDPRMTGEATATDACGEVEISYEDTFRDGCGGTGAIARTWTAEDDCGNVSKCVQIIRIRDNVPPDITCPDGGEVECGVPFEFVIVAEDACDPDPPRIEAEITGGTDVQNVILTSLGNGVFTVEFIGSASVEITATATDGCGNSASCSFVLFADCFDACSPGYWRQPQHFDSWCPTGFNPQANECFVGPATKFVDAFMLVDLSAAPVGFDPNLTMVQALEDNGGSYFQALFHGTAALLNASHPGVNFGVDPADVKEVMQKAFAGTISFAEAHNTFATWNSVEQTGGCPLN
jgi:hypothetical protein